MEKLNIAEILKDCPKGMELDCTMFDDVTFVGIHTQREFPIEIKVGRNTKYLTKEGCYHRLDYIPSTKCVIFPKGKTTWEGFQRPFKDGDVVAYDNSHRDNLQIFIFKDKRKNDTLSHCYLMLDGNELDLEEGSYYVTRLATEEEKQKLFDAIKANGYKWNPETKTLEKLIELKFKVGDIIQDVDTYKVKITEVNIEDECYGYESMIAKGIGSIGFSEQDNWKLVPNKFDITTLKPFDKVLVRDADNRCWSADIYSHYLGEDKLYQFQCVGIITKQCIPYEGNEHLLGTTNDCDEYFKTWE